VCYDWYNYDSVLLLHVLLVRRVRSELHYFVCSRLSEREDRLNDMSDVEETSSPALLAPYTEATPSGPKLKLSTVENTRDFVEQAFPLLKQGSSMSEFVNKTKMLSSRLSKRFRKRAALTAYFTYHVGQEDARNAKSATVSVPPTTLTLEHNSPPSATAEVPPAFETDESSVPPSGQVSLKKRKHPDEYRPAMLDELVKSSSDETSSEDIELEEHAPTKIQKRAVKEDLNNNREVVRSPLAASSGVRRGTTNTRLMDKKSTKDVVSFHRSPLQGCEIVRQPRPSCSSSTRKSMSSERHSGSYRRSPRRDHHPHRSVSRESRDRYGSRTVERRLPASREGSRYKGPYPVKRLPVRVRPVDFSYRRQHTQQQSERSRRESSVDYVSAKEELKKTLNDLMDRLG